MKATARFEWPVRPDRIEVSSLGYLAAAILCAGLALAGGPARADPAAVEAFYRGRTVTLLVATSPRGVSLLSHLPEDDSPAEPATAPTPANFGEIWQHVLARKP